MQEIILNDQNIESLPDRLLACKDNKIKVFFPDYYDHIENEKRNVPEYNEKNIMTIDKAKRIADKRGIEIISNHRSYAKEISKDLNLDDFSNSVLLCHKNKEKKDKPKISLIICTCNRKDHLRKTLYALTKQRSEKSFEVIVADDSSSDGTSEMIRELDPPFQLKHIYWPREKDFRSGSAENRVGPLRNLGVRNSRGEMLIFLDADIVANENFLEEHYGSCDESSVVIGPSIREKEKMDTRENYFSICKDDIDSLDIKWTLLHSGNFSVYKCNFDKVGGFDKDFIFYGKEDEEIGFRFAKLGLKFKLNRKAYGIHLYHEPEYINETIKKIMHLYQVRVFYKKYLDKTIFYRYEHRLSPHLIKAGNKCNNNCVFCKRLEKKSFKDKPKEEIISELRIAKGNNLDIVLGGGEPAIRKDFLEILDHANELGLDLELLTNGRIFSNIDHVQKIKKRKVKRVMVYVYGHDENNFEAITRAKKSFRQSLKGIKNLCDSGIEVSVNAVITKHNYKALSKISKLCHKLGTNTVHITTIPDDMSNRELKHMARAICNFDHYANITFRDHFINCFNSERGFKNKIQKEEKCARCIINSRCPFIGNSASVRIDDVYENQETLSRAVDMLLQKRIHVSLQIIPKIATIECARWAIGLKQKNPSILEIGQHGWSHTNYDITLEENYEFGKARSYEEQYNDILRGKERMMELFGDKSDPVFTPPYHGFDNNTIMALAKLNFEKIYLGKGPAKGIHGCRAVNYDIDPLYYKKSKAYPRDIEKVKKELKDSLRSFNEARLLLHAQYIDEGTFNIIEYLGELIQNSRKDEDMLNNL